jgi:hypothetical protein
MQEDSRGAIMYSVSVRKEERRIANTSPKERALRV